MANYLSEIKLPSGDIYKLKDSEKTDEKVKQTANTEDKEFPIILKNTNNTTPETNGVKYVGGVTVNPSEKTVTATEFVGNVRTNKLIPAVKKTWANTSYYATAANQATSTWFFLSVKPDSWYKPWSVRFKIRSYCPGHLNFDSVTYSTYSGRADSYLISNWNERYDHAHYYTTIRLLKNAGFTAGLGHAIGVSLLYSNYYTTAGYYRTFELDYYDCDGCTVTVLDNPVLWTGWANNSDDNYGGYNNSDAVSRGLQESSDSNSYDLLQMSNNFFVNGSPFRMPGYTLMGYDREGKGQAISLYNSSYDGNTVSINTDRVYNTNGIDYTRGIFYQTGGNYGVNAIVTVSTRTAASAIDLRYSDNCVASTSATTLGMVREKPVYFRGTLGTDGLFYLAPLSVTYSGSTYKRAWTQDVPTGTDGYVYWFIGYPYYNGTYYPSGYQINLHAENPLYWFHNGRFEEYSSASTIAWADVTGKPSTATAWPNWGQIQQSGANNIEEGSSDVTANTEILTSYASNNGFTDSNAVGKVYRRDASKIVNATLVKAALGTNATHNNTFLRKDGTWATAAGLVNTDAQTFSGVKTFDNGLHIYGTISTQGTGSVAGTMYPGGAYHSGHNSIILHGDTAGVSGIGFTSEKATKSGTTTNINGSSDRAFIQYHAYGVTPAAEGTAPALATSGELGTLVIGVGNDATDTIRLQAPGTAGILHQIGATAYPIPHTTNTNGSVGGTTTPVYVEAGVIKPLSYTIAKSVPSDAVFTDHYAWGDITGKPTKITLTGAVTGNVSLDAGELTLSTSVNHNHNSSYLTAVGYDTTNKKIYYTKNGSNTDIVTVATLRTDMGLSNALHFIGITSTTLTDGSTTATLTAKSTNSLTKTTGFVDGDVVMDGDQLREYVWSGSAWRLLGITTSTAYTQPASTATNTWIAQVSQGTDGKITATTGSLNTSGTWSGKANTAGTADKISNLVTADQASSSATWRRVWISYSDNVTGRPAWTDNLVFQTSTNTLKTTKFQGALIGNADSATTSTWTTLLKPIASTTTASASTWNIPSGSKQVWGERFSDSTLKYTPSGGSETTVTDTGDWTMWLTSGGTSNAATFNMRIDGTYYGSFSGNLSGNATTATKAGVSTIWLYPENNNEINFGGTNTGTTLYFGYRAKDSRPIPTKFVFGSSTGTADLQAKTIYLGSGTSSYISSTQYTGNAATATTATNLANNPSIQASTSNTNQVTITAGGKTSSAYTIPYATSAGSATNAAYLTTPSITTEENIESGTRAYQGSGSGWTGSVTSMAYAGILQVCGGYSRGWQIWATRGNDASEGLHWRNPIGAATAWNTERIILDSGNTHKPDTTPTLSWGAESTVFTLNGTAVKVKSMAKPTYTYSDVDAAPSSTVSCTTANVKSALGTGSDTTKFLNNKGEWAVPAYTTSLAWSAITSKPNLSTGNARIFYGTSSTAAGTAAKVVTCSIYDAYTAGDILVVKFDNANTAGSPTLNVNSKGAKNIRKIYNGAVNTLNANGEITGTCMFVYDGTQWLLTNADYNNTYTIPTSFSITANATDGLWDLTGTNGTNAVTYALAPYSSKGTTATFYTAATNPTLTTRLNYDGYLYATKLYSGGTEVSVSGHTHSYLSSISWSGDSNLKLKQSVNGAAATDVLQFAAGSNITLTGASGKLTIAGTPDTKNTAGSTNSDSKLYLIGAASQAANPQTYSDAHVFETNGAFSAKTLGVNADTDNDKVTLQWNSTDNSLDFVFA